MNVDFSDFPNGTPEREYLEALAEVFTEGPLGEGSLDAGLALLHFLTAHDLVRGAFDTRLHPCAGSVEFDAEFVAGSFPQLGFDGRTWAEVYRATPMTDLHREWEEKWREAALRKVDQLIDP